jgi:hypothetical protein
MDGAITKHGPRKSIGALIAAARIIKRAYGGQKCATANWRRARCFMDLRDLELQSGALAPSELLFARCVCWDGDARNATGDKYRKPARCLERGSEASVIFSW